MVKEYNLKILPRILEILGPNMYTNVYYIIGELIANAFDADAENVYVEITDTKIVIEDDGIGMTYEDFGLRYLEVGKESRKTNEEDFTEKGRKKMGRKGIGKLAALSISDEVYVKSIDVKTKDKSGCILTKNIDDTGRLEPIEESKISFNYNKSDNGTRIEMINPVLKVPKTMKTFKKNISRVFPFVDDDFKIHIVLDGKIEQIDDPCGELISDLATLKLFYDSESVKDPKSLDKKLQGYESKYKVQDFVKETDKKNVLFAAEPIRKGIRVRNKDGVYGEYILEIKGWIGTYRSTQGKRISIEDFSDNFLSIYSKGKLGQYNIIPKISKNKMYEVYVAGQLHIDLFEETTLPDMALSNRQGYKSDDIRYIEALELLKTELSEEVNRHTHYKKLSRKKKEQKKYENEKKKTLLFNEEAKEVLKRIDELGKTAGEGTDEVKKKMKQVYHLKSEVEDFKKSILISHASTDRDFADLLELLLLHCGVDHDAILYTSSTNHRSHVPGQANLYDYLRDFFVNSVNDKLPYVLYVCSKTFVENWNATLEAGAGWVLKADHDIFVVDCCDDAKQPLNNVKYVPKLNLNGMVERDQIKEINYITSIVKNICEERFGLNVNQEELFNYAKGIMT